MKTDTFNDLKPRLHLPRSSYDFSVCDFLYDFVDIVGDFCVYNSYGHRAIF